MKPALRKGIFTTIVREPKGCPLDYLDKKLLTKLYLVINTVDIWTLFPVGYIYQKLLTH